MRGCASRASIRRLLCLGLFATITQFAAAGMTAADYGIRLADDVAAALPLPPGLTVGGQRQVLSTYYVNFTFDTPWPEVLEFFATRLARGGWEIISEVAPEEASGAREASWTARGHGVDIAIDLQSFRRTDGDRGVGVLQVRPMRD